MEMRQHPRVDTNEKMIFGVDSMPAGNGVILDKSEGGVFLSAKDVVLDGELCQSASSLEGFNPGDYLIFSDRATIFYSRIAWKGFHPRHKKHGLGLQFIDSCPKP